MYAAVIATNHNFKEEYLMNHTLGLISTEKLQHILAILLNIYTQHYFSLYYRTQMLFVSS